MQIFRNKTWVTGIEYRDAEGKPREDSIIIPDDSEEAKKIAEGFDFRINENGIEILQEKKEEAKREEKKQLREQKRAEKRAATLAAIIAKRKVKENLTAKELQDAVDILIDAVFNPEDE